MLRIRVDFSGFPESTIWIADLDDDAPVWKEIRLGEFLSAVRGKTMICDNLDTDAKTITNLLVRYGYRQLDITKRPGTGYFTTMSAGNQTYWIRWCDNGLDCRVSSFNHRFPYCDLRKVGRDEMTAFKKVIDAASEAKLFGYTMASATRHNWMYHAKGAKEVFGVRFNERGFTAEDKRAIDDSLRGGIVWVNPKIQGKLVRDVWDFDFSSQYPYIALTKALPWGAPAFFLPEEWAANEKTLKIQYPIQLFKVYIDATIRPGFFPVLSLRSNESYSKEFPDHYQGTMWLWKWELDLVRASYKGTIEEMSVRAFKARKGLFDDYLRPLLAQKESGDYLHAYLAKMQVNLFLGKFAGKRSLGSIVQAEDGSIDFEEHLNTFVYPALWSAICAWGRRITASAINAIGGSSAVYYVDTDGFVTPKGPETAEAFDMIGMLDPRMIGRWKISGKWQRACFFKPKIYSYIDECGELGCRIAGANARNPVTPETMATGSFDLISTRIDVSSELPVKREIAFHYHLK